MPTPGRKAAAARKPRQAGAKAALTRNRRAAGRKAVATRKRRAAPGRTGAAMSPRYRTPSDIHPSLSYDDAPAAIDWLCRVFAFTRRFVVHGPSGRVEHSELSLGTGVVMVSSSKPDAGRVSPRRLQGGVAHALSVYVSDPDMHFQQALLSGARILRPLQDEEYGARGYMAEDPEGHQWYFGNYRPGAYWDAA